MIYFSFHLCNYPFLWERHDWEHKHLDMIQRMTFSCENNLYWWCFSGKDIVAVDSPIGRLGLSVCYDLRFPEMYQLLRFKHGAQVLSRNISFLLTICGLGSNIILCFTFTTYRYYWFLQHSPKLLVKHIGKFFFVLEQLRINAM